MQQKSELPEGWISSQLINLLLKKKGKKPSLLAEEEWDGSVPYLDIKAFESGDIRQYADINSSVFINKGDILIVWDGARCGLVGKAPVDGAIGSTLMHLSQDSLNPDYLYYFLKSNYEHINSNPRGTGIPHVDPNIFWNLKIPVPPLLEQHRIISAIEALFARLDATNEKLDSVLGILKKFRESVLAAAFEGRLTEEWRVECAGDIEWNWQNINEIGVVSGGLTKNQKRLNYSIKLPYLRVANVYANRLELDEMKEIGVLEDEINRYLLEEGDLLVVEGNGSIDQIGRVALWDGSIKPCLHQNHIIKVRFSHDVYNKYILYWLLSPIGRENITSSSSSTSGLNTLSISKVGKLPVPLFPLSEQQEIVRRVDALFAFADSIEAKVTATREKTEKLRQSILAKAFSGELVPTEAELARREGRDYESAEALLKRIKGINVIPH